MKKYDVYNKIKSEGVVVVIRGNDIQEALSTVEA